MKRERIYMSSPDVGESEKEAILRALDSGWIAPLGPEVDAFEEEIAAACDRKYAVALSSGTAALHLALLALGVKPGDLVPTSTMTFAATANAITYVGAKPFFVDSLPDTGNMDPELLDQALTEIISRGDRVGAVVPVDLLGKVADYPAIQEVINRHEQQAGYRIPLLSDAAESLGAALNGVPAGKFGEAAIFSFNGNKIMTTSGGGMLVTDNKELADKVRYLATQARQPVAHYEHTDIGYNYRMSNLLAALGRAQLERVPDMMAQRKALRDRYADLFSPIPGVQIFGRNEDDSNPGDDEDNFWLTAILIDPTTAGWDAGDLSQWLTERNIESRPLWKPMHLQPVFQGEESLDNTTSQTLFETGITLPSGSALTEEQITRVLRAIREFLETHSG